MTKFNIPCHVYECEDCIVTFAVEQAFEDQVMVKCPICRDDVELKDIGAGDLLQTKTTTR